jgi:hypothetical protein
MLVWGQTFRRHIPPPTPRTYLERRWREEDTVASARNVLDGIYPFVGFAALLAGTSGVFFTYSEAKTFGWLSVAGEVTSTGIDRNRNIDDDSGHVSYTYSPRVTYAYTVEGLAYESQLVAILRISTSGGGYARDKIAMYPVGSSVTVYYDPANPSMAVLETGYSVATYIMLGAAVLLAAAALGIRRYLRIMGGQLPSRRLRRRLRSAESK